MQLGMGLLALVCLGLGLAPVVVAPALGRLLAGLGGLPETSVAFTLGVSLQTPMAFGQISPVGLGVLGLTLLGLTLLALRVFRVNRHLRVSDSWGCGRIGQTPRMEYTATAFAEPLRRVFAELYRPTRELTIDFHPESKYFVQAIHYQSDITPWFERNLYEPFLRLIGGAAHQVRRLQSGSLHLYLLYLALALVALLFATRWF
jgi:hypothetical protein